MSRKNTNKNPLHVVLLNPPYKDPNGSGWIPVPPRGYGGIQRVVGLVQAGLLASGHRVTLIGAPGSQTLSPNHTVMSAVTPDEIRDLLETLDHDVVHDHSNGMIFNPAWMPQRPFISTHHLTGTPQYPINAVYLSYAQRQQAKAPTTAPVVRIPVDPTQFRFRNRKEPFLLFLGRVSPWKGALEAAAFAKAASMDLVIAGPSWEGSYLDDILTRYPTVNYIGEVRGDRLLDLLGKPSAILVLSQSVEGPWGDRWVEPGATVVSEAASSGTPVVATANGCLGEIVPHVGKIVPEGAVFQPTFAQNILKQLPLPAEVQTTATNQWHLAKITATYVQIYRRVLDGLVWDNERDT